MLEFIKAFSPISFSFDGELNMILSKFSDDVNDIVIYHQFRDSNTISAKLKQSKIFRRVVDAYEENDNLKDILRLVFSKTYLKDCLKDLDDRYDTFFCACSRVRL